jgi:hypothetical protein
MTPTAALRVNGSGHHLLLESNSPANAFLVGRCSLGGFEAAKKFLKALGSGRQQSVADAVIACWCW